MERERERQQRDADMEMMQREKEAEHFKVKHKTNQQYLFPKKTIIFLKYCCSAYFFVENSNNLLEQGYRGQGQAGLKKAGRPLCWKC